MIPKPALLTLLLLPVLFHACTPPEPPISAAEALAFSKKIERSIIRQNPTLLDNIFDDKWFGRQVAAATGNTMKASTVDAAVQDIRKAHFGQRILSLLGKDGTYTLLRQYEKDNRQHLLFRIYDAEGGTNYHDFQLVKVNDQIKAMDVYVYESGESLSKIMADLLILMEADGPTTTYSDKEKTRIMVSLRRLIDQKQFEAARNCYDSLPADYKRQKIFQLYHIQIGQHMGDSLNIQCLLEYQTLFPNDPSLYLTMINAYSLQKQYPKALAAVNKLDSLVGKDPFQDYYRGHIYNQMKDSARALACFERVHAYLPSFHKGATALLASYMQAGDLDKAVRLTRQSQADSTFSATDMDVIYQTYPALKKKMP